ncbi:MAG: DMT family transporter [Candidatus Lokiarchaeota archaeon]|nr:DMT family transporter [Candidatus Lokiarchaeota archaeon]
MGISIGYYLAFVAAFLYGLSTPLNKLLLSSISPLVLSGWSYLFSGIILLPGFKSIKVESSLMRQDLPKLFLIVFFGSFLGPLFYLFGLNRASAFQASLFQNSEAVFTILIAIFVFHEKISIKNAVGMALILSILLFWSIDFNLIAHFQIISAGALFILLGCACWAIDNNITQTLSKKSSIQITSFKCVFGGIVSLLLAFFLGSSVFLRIENFLYVGIVGFFTFGLSIICFTTALRYIGTIKTIVILSLSPFIAAVLSIFIIGDSINILDIFIFAVLLFSVFYFMREKHSHIHFHGSLVHSHLIPSNDSEHQEVRIIKREKKGVKHEHLNYEHEHEHYHHKGHKHARTDRKS